MVFGITTGLIGAAVPKCEMLPAFEDELVLAALELNVERYDAVDFVEESLIDCCSRDPIFDGNGGIVPEDGVGVFDICAGE